MRTSQSLLVATTAAVAFGLCGCASGGSGAAGAAPSLPVVSPTPTASPEPLATAPLPTPAPTPKPTPTPTPSPTHVGLQLGDHGPDVLALQQRLTQLGFWISGSDGTYGDTTSQAVLAVQKAAGLSRDGVAGPVTLLAVKRGVSVQPRTTSGHWLEIDKARQLLLVVTNGKVDAVLNTSTGSGLPYQEGGQTYIATTPPGQFSIFREVNHDDPGPLGDLWRPKYFNGGIAVHGAAAVPAYPASHGCARVSDAAIDWIWASGQAPIGTKVWVY